ncbi:helix-turn-helix domain-containing protein [Leuconostoc citreum]|uniref:helix-turn-helix domain-containing protein n=1 Tax=Leuconostoc citreum TaxID=33964 RepID=UPI0032DFF6A4
MFSSLSSHERSVIETIIKLNHSIRDITRFLNRSPATIAYELKRITPYNATIADTLVFFL